MTYECRRVLSDRGFTSMYNFFPEMPEQSKRSGLWKGIKTNIVTLNLWSEYEYFGRSSIAIRRMAWNA